MMSWISSVPNYFLLQVSLQVSCSLNKILICNKDECSVDYPYKRFVNKYHISALRSYMKVTLSSLCDFELTINKHNYRYM